MGGSAWLFPGQASQFVGMGQDLCAAYPEAREVFAAADELLGMPLSRLCFGGPAAELMRTEITQPAVFVHSMAVWRVLAAAGLQPAAVAGHSLGEYSALVAAGVLELGAGLALVQRRARFMQEAAAARPGAMVALIGLDVDTVLSLCRQAQERDQVAVLANINAPGQLVVSGDVAAVERVRGLAERAGARRAIPLAVSGAFHSPLMAPAAERLRPLLLEAPLQAPRVPVVANLTGAPASDAETIRQNLLGQLIQPVRWVETVQALARLGLADALEVGPGAVLQGLVRRIDAGMAVRTTGTASELAAVLAARRSG